MIGKCGDVRHMSYV